MPEKIPHLPVLVMEQGPQLQKTYVLKKNVTIIGSDEKNDIVVKEDYISAHHAMVTKLPGGWVIEDLGSRSGVLINGQPIKGPFYLRERARVNLGPNVMLVASGEALGAMPGAPGIPGPGFSALVAAAFLLISVFVILLIVVYFYLFW